MGRPLLVRPRRPRGKKTRRTLRPRVSSRLAGWPGGSRATMGNDGRMTERCAHCGHLLPEGARFCSECGVTVRAGPASRAPLSSPGPLGGVAPPGPAPGAKTLMHFGAVNAQASTPPAQPRLNQTLLGLPAAARTAPVAAAPPPTGAAPEPSQGAQPLQPVPPLAYKQTMMGVATPGIAPLQGAGGGTLIQRAGAPLGPGLHGTLAAPLSSSGTTIVPAPAPLQRSPTPARSQDRPRQRGPARHRGSLGRRRARERGHSHRPSVEERSAHLGAATVVARRKRHSAPPVRPKRVPGRNDGHYRRFALHIFGRRGGNHPGSTTANG